MHILSKIKDYYDWYSSVMGIDTSVTFDRRKCTPIDPDNIMCPHREYFANIPLRGDKVKTELGQYWRSQSVLYRCAMDEREAKTFKELVKKHAEAKKRREGTIYHMILEIGDTHYFFEIERYLDDNDNGKVHKDAFLVAKKEHIEKRYGGDEPIVIIPISRPIYGRILDDIWRPEPHYEQFMIVNPILANTFIPSFIPPEEIWTKIYNFLSSLKDKPFVDSRTNNEHIESAGFDTKDSFRPKKKN